MGRIILIRHGQSELNRDGIYYGWLNPNLTPLGIEQAKKVKEKLSKFNYDYIYCSDLQRAIDTAKIINYKQLEIFIDNRIRELNFGIFEGLTYKEIKEKYPKQLEQSEKNWKTYNFETGESPVDVQNRVIDFIENLDKNSDHLIVTHWGVINSILSYYLSKNLDSYWKFSTDNSSITIIEFVDGFPVLKLFNY